MAPSSPSMTAPGKLLVPLVVRRQAQQEMPRNVRNLKQQLESDA
jgi:hypothetical protein